MLRLCSSIVSGIVSALLCVAAGQNTAPSDAAALQAAIRTEVVDGDLAGAIRQYESLAGSQDRPTALRALQRMARCYEKMGDRRAVEVYERIGKQFADQKETVQEASQHIAALSQSQERPDSVGWYNGDWQPGIPGLMNRCQSKMECTRVYDDFIVPEGGWTVVAVFSDNHMDFAGVTKAVWEIRRGMRPGAGGQVVASGVSGATQNRIPGTGPFPRDPLIGYRIQVDNLHVVLAPGRYWLSVAPLGRDQSYADATLGKNAVGNPPGNDGYALFSAADGDFQDTVEVGHGGQLGIAQDFSLGVLVSRPSK